MKFLSAIVLTTFALILSTDNATSSAEPDKTAKAQGHRLATRSTYVPPAMEGGSNTMSFFAGMMATEEWPNMKGAGKAPAKQSAEAAASAAGAASPSKGEDNG